jgi:hypothetical protein
MEAPHKPYILGLDLGVQSVGWTVIDLDPAGRPCGVRATKKDARQTCVRFLGASKGCLLARSQ